VGDLQEAREATRPISSLLYERGPNKLPPPSSMNRDERRGSRFAGEALQFCEHIRSGAQGRVVEAPRSLRRRCCCKNTR